jgi:hypothetical protein
MYICMYVCIYIQIMLSMYLWLFSSVYQWTSFLSENNYPYFIYTLWYQGQILINLTKECFALFLLQYGLLPKHSRKSLWSSRTTSFFVAVPCTVPIEFEIGRGLRKRYLHVCIHLQMGRFRH